MRALVGRGGRRRRAKLIGLLAVLALVLTAVPAGAAGHLEVVADGLDNPRGIALGPGHRIYVAEAGRGGDTLVEVAAGGGEGPICLGMTGSITEIRKGRHKTLIDLPSYAETETGDCSDAGFAATGPHDVALNGRGTLSLVIGLGGSLDVRNEIADAYPAAALFGTAHRVLPNGGNRLLADLARFEETDPDGEGPDSNPYGIALLPGGKRLAVDSGGNTLIELGKRGAKRVIATFAPQCVAWGAPFPNPIPPEFNPCGDQTLFPASSVPTAVAIGPDGDYYVSELGGFPFTPGTARVWKIDADLDTTAVCSTFAFIPADGCEVYASGLTSLVDIAFGDDGSLFAVQFADAGVLAAEFGGPLDGSVQVIAPGGGAPIGEVGGLTVPGGVAIADGYLYITNNSIFSEAGQVVRTEVP